MRFFANAWNDNGGKTRNLTKKLAMTMEAQKKVLRKLKAIRICKFKKTKKQLFASFKFAKSREFVI